LIALGITRLRFDVEILNLLPERLSVAQGLKLYQQNFSDARELIMTVETAAEDETEAAARALAEVLRAESNLVAQVTWQPGWLENPGQSTELVAALWFNQPPAELAALTNRLSPANLTNLLAEAREQMATSFSPDEIGTRGYDPYGLMRLPASVAGTAPSSGRGAEFFTSPDGLFRVLFVEAKPDLTSYRSCRDWLAAIRRVVDDARRSGSMPAGAQVHYTGRPAFVTEIAGGMETDMTGSAGGTLVTIGVLFWLAHRRLRPLFWLLFLLVIILAGTTALGGLILGTINVVSMGFASILLGLAEDFGIVVYQESRSHPELDARQLRREVAPGILWSAVTTAGAFLILNFSTLPGLGQLGTLVAIGIMLAAVMMLFIYLPPLLRWRRARDKAGAGLNDERFLLFTARRLWPTPVVWTLSVVLLLGSLAVLLRHGPRFDHSPNVLKPRNSEANATLEQIKARFGRTQDPLWVLVPGRDEAEVARRLTAAEATLSRALSNQLIDAYTLPTALWPQPENQKANRPTLAAFLQERPLLERAAVAAGFTTNSLFVTGSIFDHWARALASPNVFWPTNDASRWILNKVVARPPGGFLALGPIHPAPSVAATRKLAAEWPPELLREGVLLSGWELLGTTVFETVVRELPRVLLPIFLLVVLSLWLAFRHWRDVALSLLTLAFSGLLLGAIMVVLRWEWNLLNLMALPLLLGMGVDFSIHIQLALRRHQGDLLAVRRSVGRALLLAGATTVAGFASLAFSTNAGMASLGKVCALGIALALLVAVYLLPVWWKVSTRKTTAE
jgi:predicted RND superfamily exporter protein